MRSRVPSRTISGRALRRASASLLLLAALGLTACGADEPESARTPQDVERDLTRALTDRGEACETNYATRRFVARSSYGTPAYATRLSKICAEHVEQFVARSVKVSGVRVSGDRATATVTATGGSLAFGDVTFALVLDGVWRLDRITALDVDRAKFNAVQRQAANVSDPPTTDAQVDCTLRLYGRLDDKALERAIMMFDPTFVTEPTLVCFLRPELRRQGLTSAEASCVVRELRSADGLVGILLGEDQKKVEGLFAQAIPRCAQSSI